MPIAATIPVRLSDDLLARLDAYAKKIGVSRSAAIRLCLGYQLGAIATADPKELRTMDGRAFRYSASPRENQPVAHEVTKPRKGRYNLGSLKPKPGAEQQRKTI